MLFIRPIFRAVILAGLFSCFIIWPAHSKGQIDASLTCSSELNQVALSLFGELSQADLRSLCGTSVQTHSITSEQIGEPMRFVTGALPDVGGITFYGLASFYNKTQAYLLRSGELTSLASLKHEALIPTDWIVLSGRYDALVFRVREIEASLNGGELAFRSPRGTPIHVDVLIAPKGRLGEVNTDWPNMNYVHIGEVLAGLAKLLEQGVHIIHDLMGLDWGWTVLVFAVVMKAMLLPASLVTVHLQRRVNRCQSILDPQLAEIRRNYKGEEAHKRIMAAHKAIGVTPFYSLKPTIGLVIHIPFLIAIFAVLGEMPELSGSAFLWIDDLALPDAIATIGFVVPGFGDSISLLPIIMATVTIISALTFHDPHLAEGVMKRQRRSLFLMAGGFFILFYPFPAAIVFYWVLNNIFQAVQQQLLKA